MEYIRHVFDISNPSAKLFARYITVALWIIGSLYLMNYEISKSDRDWLIILATPFIWLIVISIPVIAWEAIRERRYFAGVFLLFCGIVGSVYTLSGTIARQASSRDISVKVSNSNDTERKKLTDLIVKDEAMLAEALKKQITICRDDDTKACNGVKRTVEVYESSLKNHKKELKDLGSIQSPTSGEERISDIIALTGFDKNVVRHWVVILLPIFFGVFCELAAMASAIYGFHNMQLLALGQEFDSTTIVGRKITRIDFLQKQLTLPNTTNIDRRAIEKQLDIARNDLINHVNKGKV